jgi:DNA-binding MltR family transcriptional regulator
MIRASMARNVPRDWEAVFAELDGANDRAVILVVGSLIDYALAEVIKSRLREPKTDKGWNDLFKESGPLQTWSQKTTVAYFLKIIGPIARADIDLLRSIRNGAAHDMNPITFDAEQIADKISKLQMGNENTRALPLRQQFLAAARMYIANLLLRAGDSNAEIADASRALAPYLDR